MAARSRNLLYCWLCHKGQTLSETNNAFKPFLKGKTETQIIFNTKKWKNWTNSCPHLPSLWLYWPPTGPKVGWCMANPSHSLVYSAHSSWQQPGVLLQSGAAESHPEKKKSERKHLSQASTKTTATAAQWKDAVKKHETELETACQCQKWQNYL